MDVIGTTLLKELHKHEDFKEAIIAGGFLRDHLMGETFKDIDVFLPVHNTGHLYQMMRKHLYKEGPLQIADFTGDHYGNGEDGFSGIIQAKYLDNIDVQIIGYAQFNTPWKKAGHFPTELLKTFDYNINKVYYDGHDLVETKEFEYDKIYRTATLSYLPSIEYLPRAMDRFIRLKAKFPDIRFRSTALQLKENKDQEN